MAIRENQKLSDDERPKLMSEEYYLKDKESIAEDFAAYIDALENTILVAEACHVQIEMNRKLLPKFPVPNNQTASSFLRDLCRNGLKERITNLTTTYMERLNYELDIIERMEFSDYFFNCLGFYEVCQG